MLTLEGAGDVALSIAGTTLFATETYTSNQVIAVDTGSGDVNRWVLDPDLRPYQRDPTLGPVLVWNGQPLITRGSEELVTVPLYPAAPLPDATPVATSSP